MKSYYPVCESSPIMDVADVIALEKRIEANGTPLSVLMEQAGTALAKCAADHCKAGSRILLLCGTGNNGGDGWVAARLLAAQGFEVVLATQFPPDQIKAQPARDAALRTLKEAGEQINILVGATIPSDAFESCSAIIDCILGTGFDAETVKEPYATWIIQANEATGFKLACDAPSGLSAQTGKAASSCFSADATITMLAVKTGLLAQDATHFTGKLYLAELKEGSR